MHPDYSYLGLPVGASPAPDDVRLEGEGIDKTGVLDSTAAIQTLVNAALASLMTQLQGLGLVVDGTVI